MKEQSSFERSMRLHDEDDHGVWIRSTRALRQAIGILGMALPILLWIFSPSCDDQPIESISHYYYTRSADFLIVILSLVGVFLILYTKDFVLSTIAGMAALSVVFFPTSQLLLDCAIVTIPSNGFREGFHYVSAVVFLVILMYMTLRHFTKPDQEDIDINHIEVDYKWVYQVCGIIMLLALLVLGFRFYMSLNEKQFADLITWYEDHKLTFWMEVVALEAFGIAWLVKGRKTIKMSQYRAALKSMEKVPEK